MRAVESEGVVVPGYVNRPIGPASERSVRLAATGHDGSRRASMRMALVALAAYEQRAEHRARLRAWLLARSSIG